MATATLATMSIHEQAKPSMRRVTATAATTTSTPARTVNTDEVRVIGIDEYKEAAACLAEAFKDDHTTHYFLNTPDSTMTEEQKWDLHVEMMEYITYAHCLKGMVTTVGPNYSAVSLW
jgi:hypothetical protein